MHDELCEVLLLTSLPVSPCSQYLNVPNSELDEDKIRQMQEFGEEKLVCCMCTSVVECY